MLNRKLTAVLAFLAAPAVMFGAHIVQHNLVSDLAGIADHQDLSLVNSWGIVHGPSTPWWVADNGTGVSTLYNGAGVSIAALPFVNIPGPGNTGQGTPTGTVFNATADFVYKGVMTRFLFSTEDGTVAVWPAGAGINAQIAIDTSTSPAGAVYKGIAIGQQGAANRIYLANFHTGAIEVYDANFQPVSMPTGAFTDGTIPAGFAPFNIMNIDGKLFVSFAMQKQPDRKDESDGPGLGYVDVFDGWGNLTMRLEHGKWMNAPWGMAHAPANFGQWSNRLIIGQFGSGQIATFNANSGEFEGLLRGPHGKPININGLWGLGFGNDAAAGPSNTLFFAAGLDDEAHGLFGTLAPSKTDDDGEDDDSGRE
ncbi:MAG TPA: TIGR03118 family protein [Bryobacteraceae bacterium]|nr:TIGR03118 family protein [Bryobacteraceae bacterium]